MKKIVFAALLLLTILQQDFFLAGRIEPLFLGFLPVGLVWHMGISIAAAALWALAVARCWPEGLTGGEGESAPGRG
jgi:hypothetical protein